MSDVVNASSRTDLQLNGVHLAGHPAADLFNIKVLNNKIYSITAQPGPPASQPTSPPSLLLPSLCHPHIHLDKAFILTSNTDRYRDLAPAIGTFQEALSNTSQAKARYDIPDLFLRGSQLIAESVQSAATSIRAFVEVNHTVGTKCVDAAVALKRRFEKDCFVQVCAFAQDPIFSGEHDYQNRSLLEKALAEYKDEIDVLGTTPYVEIDHKTAIRNIEWAVHAALQRNVHLDFHLDYNLDPER